VAGIYSELEENCGFCSAIEIDLARKSLGRCDLCGRACGVDRYKNAGPCGLDERAYCSHPFVHICEEPTINPAASMKMFGCGMK
jgi:uncharacterized Fe-S radical SAM superfamily protein PflX